MSVRRQDIRISREPFFQCNNDMSFECEDSESQLTYALRRAELGAIHGRNARTMLTAQKRRKLNVLSDILKVNKMLPVALRGDRLSVQVD
jgi:hypothetical protein